MIPISAQTSSETDDASADGSSGRSSTLTLPTSTIRNLLKSKIHSQLAPISQRTVDALYKITGLAGLQLRLGWRVHSVVHTRSLDIEGHLCSTEAASNARDTPSCGKISMPTLERMIAGAIENAFIFELENMADEISSGFRAPDTRLRIRWEACTEANRIALAVNGEISSSVGAGSVSPQPLTLIWQRISAAVRHIGGGGGSANAT